MPVDLNQAKSLFLTMLEMPANERAAYLDAQCGDDQSLRQRVEAMLQAHEASGELLPRPAPEILACDAPTLAPDSQAQESEDSNQDTSHEDVIASLSPSTRPSSVGRLGHYEIQEVLGQGGFGTVFKAFDEKLHRMVAIKVLSRAFARNGSARKRFIREAQSAAAVKNEHVVAIYSVQDESQPPYLVMELIDGISLQDKLDKKGPLSLKEILRIGLQIAEGLGAAHKQGLVHRDIKPANILLENGVERVKITDFGLARAVDDASITQSGTVAGTPMYMSPEQAGGLSVDHRSDLFSFGSVLYAMCTGHPPFCALGTIAVLMRVIEDTPRPINEINPEIPEGVCAIIAKLHAKKPEERFQTAKEVGEILGQYLAHIQQTNSPAPLIPRIEQPPQNAASEVPASPEAIAPASAREQLVKWLLIGCAWEILAIGLLIGLCVWIPVWPVFVLGPITAALLGTALLTGTASLVLRTGTRLKRTLLLTASSCLFFALAPASIAIAMASDWAELTVHSYDSNIHIRLKGFWLDWRLPPQASMTIPAGEYVLTAERDGKTFFTKDLWLRGYTQSIGIPSFRPPFVQTFGGASWRPLHIGGDNWNSKGDSNYEPGSRTLFSGSTAETKDKMPRNFHLRVEANLSRGKGTLRFHALPLVKPIDVAPPRDGWFVNFTESSTRQGMVDLELFALLPGQLADAKSVTAPGVARLNEWFYVEIIAHETKAEVFVNGDKAMSLTNTDFPPTQGVICLWNNGSKGSTISFRNMEIKELPAN
jgi:serine/threonine protein kinase